MNSKKNKKNLAGAGKAVNSKTEGTATNEAPKKTKKKSAVIPNENGTIKQKTRKRKQPEVGSVTVKRSKRNGVDDGMDQSSICDDDQKSGEAGLQSQAESADKDISNEQLEKEDLFSNNVEENLQAMFGEIPSPKKGKKRSKDSPVILDDIEAELYDGLQKAPCTEQIEEASSKKKKKKIKQNDSHLTLEELESTLNNNKTVAKHEVNIVDIKDQNGKEGSENVVTISIQDGDSDWEENELLKQFEKDEKEESPKGRKTAKPSWPEDDLKELINRMEVCIPENDDKAFMRRIEELEWDTIAFKNYSVEDCKKTWAIIQKKVRRFRLLKEVLEDAGKLVSETKFKKTKAKKNRHPDMPRRPLSVYFIYYLTRREAVQAENPGIEATEVAKLCSQEFKSLPPEKKEKYEKAAQKNKEEYELKMEEFYQLHPEEKLVKANKAKPEKAKSPKSAKEKPVPKLPKEKPLPKSPKEKLPPKAKAPKKSLPPFQYYLISEMEKENVEDKNSFKEVCKERWKNMSDDAKMEWISYAEAENFKYEEEMKEFLRDHPEHVVQSTQKSFLTKKEQLVKERASGRPAKPPVSSYNIFARTMLQTEKIKEVPARDRMIYVSNQWKHCSEEDKKHYKDLYDKLTQQYKNDYAAFLETLSVEERELELKKMPRKKSEEEKAKKGPKVKKTPVKRAAGKGAGPSEKKVAKKAPPRKLVEPEQPPISPFKYFVTTYKGEEPAIKAWKALPQDERKQFEVELIKKKQMYIQEFEKFLKSMTKEELEEFSKARSKVKQEQQENEDEESSDESDTDDSDEESDEED